MQPTPRDARRSFLDAPVRRLYCEVYCLALVFWLHEDNNHTKKMLTWVLTALVAPVVFAASFGYANPPNYFWPLAALWGAILARMHDFELNNFAGVEFTYDDDGDTNDSE
jgi:hypothetical protein